MAMIVCISRRAPLSESGANMKTSKGGLTMQMAVKVAVSLAVLLGFFALVQAEDAKEETLKGTITCGKCDLKLVKKCNTVIKVKDTVYWFDGESNKKYHKDTCMEAKEGTVKGTVTEKGGKKYIKVSKVEYKE
jgi:hypothetical protein